MAILYKILNRANNRSYIGVTTQPLKTRWNEHLYRLRHNKGTLKIQNDFNIYGELAFSIYSIKEGELEDMLEMEKELSKGSIIDGYNMVVGGGDYEERHGAYLIREDRYRENPLKKVEAYRKVGELNKGKIISSKQKEALSKAHKGKKISDNQLRGMKERAAGNNNPNYGNYSIYINLNTGIFYDTPELFNYLGVNKSGFQWMKKSNNPKLNNFIKV